MNQAPRERIQQLNQSVERLFAEGAKASALTAALDVMEAAEATLAAGDFVLGASINNVATIYDSLGDFASARPLYERVIELHRHGSEKDQPNLAVVLSSLAVGWWATGNTATALELLEEAWTIRRSLYGAGSSLEGRSRQTIAAVLASSGSFEEAEAILPEPTDVDLQSREIPPTVTSVLLTYGRRFESEGKYRFAIDLYEHASTAAARTFGAAHAFVAACLNNAARMQERLGRYEAAEALYGRAHEILGESDDDPLVGTTLNNIGWLRYAVGDYRSSEALLQRALAIRRTVPGESNTDLAETLNNLALLRTTTRNAGDAEKLLEEAEAILTQAGPGAKPALADTLNNLGAVLRAQGRLDEAVDAHQRSFALRAELQGAHSAAAGESVNNLGAVLNSAGRYEEAFQAFDAGYQIRRDALGDEHPAVAQSLLNAAVALQALGNHDDALPMATAALAQLQQTLGAVHADVALGLIIVAESLAATDQADAALDAVFAAATIEDVVAGQVFGIASEAEQLRFAERLRLTLHAALSLVVAGPRSSGVVDSAFDLVLRRKGIVGEVASTQRAAILGGRYPDLRPILQELTALRRRIAFATLTGPGQDAPDLDSDGLERLGQRRKDLERELASRIPAMALAQQLAAATSQNVRSCIPKGTAVVEFVRHDPYRFGAHRAQGEDAWLPSRYLAFVVTSRRRPQLVDLGEADRVDALVAGFRAFVTGEQEPWRGTPAAAGEATWDGSDLRATVFDPLAPIIGSRTRVLLAPDGDLSRLPFEALPVDGQRLIHRYEIGYVTSARELVRFGAAAAAEPTMPLVIADPDFDLRLNRTSPAAAVDIRASADLRSQPRFERLDATRREGAHIAERLGVAPMLGADALDPLVRNARSPRILHLATHGFFLPDQTDHASAEHLHAVDESSRLSRLQTVENPLLRSGLALAGANRWLAGDPLDPEVEDGILTAEDVAGMDLTATELVVLSACETGLGSVRVGEGVFGLRRAFVVAGARGLVMSLWKVPDDATAELMADFYERMLAGRPPDIALRAAQRRLMGRHPDPFYWGAFIFQGDASRPTAQVPAGRGRD